MHHELKIQETYAIKKALGSKMFEIRRDDRGFKVGDTVSYTTVDKDGNKTPQNPLEGKVYRITYVCDYQQKDGYVVFGEKEVLRHTDSAFTPFTTLEDVLKTHFGLSGSLVLKRAKKEIVDGEIRRRRWTESGINAYERMVSALFDIANLVGTKNEKTAIENAVEILDKWEYEGTEY